jgi:hypothetical protein
MIPEPKMTVNEEIEKDKKTVKQITQEMLAAYGVRSIPPGNPTFENTNVLHQAVRSIVIPII